MIYKMTLTDSSDTMTFNLLETPIVDKDIEGAVDNVTLDGNQYTDYLYLKKQYIQKWAIMCPDEYDELRGFYTRQFEDGEVPSYRVYYGANVTKDYIYNGDYFQFNAKGLETGMSLSQLTGNAEQTTYSGKNLIQPSTMFTTSYSVTVNSTDSSVEVSNGAGYATYTIPTKFEPTESVTFSCKGVQKNGDGLRVVYRHSDDGSTWTGYVNVANINTTTQNQQYDLTGTFTGYAYYQIVFYSRGYASTSTPNDAVYSNIQFEKGSTATAYEPYVGGTASPNPDYPQPISTVTGEQNIKVEGKNLLDDTALYSTLASSLTIADATFSGSACKSIKRTSATSVTYPITVNGQATLQFDLATDASSNYYITLEYSDGTSSTSITGDKTSWTNVSITSAQSKILTGIKFQLYGWTNTLYIKNIQLELGSTATAYEPYEAQEFEINLGKNLFDTDTAVTRFENIGGTQMNDWGTYQDGIVTIVKSNGAHGTCAFAGFKPTLVLGQTYTLSATIRLSGTNATNQIRFGIVQNSPNMAVSGKDVWLDVSKTFVASATDVSDSRVDIQAANTGNIIEIKNIQLELGQPTAYAPYFTPIELAKIGTYQDRIYKDDGKWYIEKQVGKIQLTSALGWYNASDVFYTASITDYAPSNNTPYMNVATGYTNVSGASAMQSNPNNSCAFINVPASTQARFYWRTTAFANVTELSTYITSNPTTVYYALATPTTTEITDETLLSQLNFIASLYGGVNNISLIGTGAEGEMEVLIRDVLDVERDVVPETPVRLTLTDGGVINACGCRRDVQLTMRETTE